MYTILTTDLTPKAQALLISPAVSLLFRDSSPIHKPPKCPNYSGGASSTWISHVAFCDLAWHSVVQQDQELRVHPALLCLCLCCAGMCEMQLIRTCVGLKTHERVCALQWCRLLLCLHSAKAARLPCKRECILGLVYTRPLNTRCSLLSYRFPISFGVTFLARWKQLLGITCMAGWPSYQVYLQGWHKLRRSVHA